MTQRSTRSPRLDRRLLRDTSHQIHQGQARPWLSDQALVDHRPVAEAVVVAEQLSTQRDRLFPPVPPRRRRAPQRPDARRVHSARQRRPATDRTAEDPGRHMRPHMFRRTMAMLTDQFPGSEIALGIQLKHIAARALANRSTQGYATPTVPGPHIWSPRSSSRLTHRGPLKPQNGERLDTARRGTDGADLQRHSPHSASSRC